MEVVRESWTDERMDDLSGRVDEGFRRNDADLRALRTETRTEGAELRSEMKAEFAAVRSEMKGEFAAVRSEMKAEFAVVRGEMSARFDSMQRLILQVGGGMIATSIVGFLGVIVAVL
jgi:hypothetical protein